MVQPPLGTKEHFADVTDETEDADDPAFGEWLRARMQARRMTQRQLARKAGIDHSTISRLLRGHRLPTLQTALQLQAALDPAGRPSASRDSPDLHPTILSAMLRSDGYLTDDEIGTVVELYARLVAARGGRFRGPAPAIGVGPPRRRWPLADLPPGRPRTG